MAAQMEKLEKSMLKLTCEVSQEAFQEAMTKAFKKLAHRFSIPGFRKGKAPMKMVTNYYGEGILYDEALEFCLDPVYQEALKEHDIKPFSHPEVEIQEIGSDKGVKFACKLAVRPEVKLGQYKGLEAYRPEVKVEDSRIDEEIEHARLRASRLVPVERPVEQGDMVTIDYKGLVDGVAFAGGTAEKQDLTIGSGKFIPGFEEQLVGHSKGEEFTIDVQFPEDYQAEELKGKAACFEIKLHEVRFRELPALDDEFVKDVSEDCDTMEEYRAHIRAEQERFANERADQTFHENVLEAALKATEIDLPELAIHDEIDRLYEQQEQQMARQGFQLADYLRYLQLSEGAFRAQLHAPAERNLKLELLEGAIVKEEKLEVSEADREHELEHMAEHVGQSVDELKKFYGEEGPARNMLDEGILAEKARKLLWENAVATGQKPEAAEAEAEAEAPKRKKSTKKSAETAEGEAKPKKRATKKSKAAAEEENAEA